MKYLILYFALLICACDLSAQKKKPAPVPPVALESGLYSGLKWRCIGPFQGGRSLSVSGVPDQPLTYYMGATGGGVWKTEDGGDYWYPISDGNFTSASVGALAVAPSDPNVIYVGMGEAALRNTALMGDGLYKSEDAGKTWKQVLKLDASATGRIAIHPTNPDIAYAAVMGKLFDKNDERGLYRTTNGGQSWSKILAVNDSTGCKDVDIDPVNPNNIYCTFWQVNRKPWKLESGGQGSGLYKSSDGGNTWKKISENPGLPRGVLGKVCMAVSPSNPSRVFAMIESKAPGLYRSDDYGENWIL
ncbi:MAG: glycosyl hydrolase, partial [Flavobacteriales bacterium]|nr:glycosyl hydrolase [Flavobacteriales bacterium]